MGPHKFRPYLNNFTMKFLIVLVAIVALATASPAPEEEAADLAAPAPERCTSTMMDRYNKWCCKNGYWDKGCSNYMKAGCSCQFKVEERAEPEERAADLAAPAPERCTSTMMDRYNKWCCKNGYWDKGCSNYMKAGCSCQFKVEERAAEEAAPEFRAPAPEEEAVPADLAAPAPRTKCEWYQSKCCYGAWPYNCTKYMRSYGCSCRGW